MRSNYSNNFNDDCPFTMAENAMVLSNCSKRKVGACLEIIIDDERYALIDGCNYHDLSACKCVAFKSDPFVIHAEQTVMQVLREVKRPSDQEIILYVTYEPCLKCAKTIVNKGVSEVYYRDSSRLHDGLNYLIQNKIRVNREWKSKSFTCSHLLSI